MNPYRFTIALRIKHPQIDPSAISSELGLTPSRSWQVGKVRTTPDGGPLDGIYQETYWTSRLLEHESFGHDLPAALEGLIEELSKHKLFFRRLRSEGGKIEFFVGWFFENKNSGEIFDHDLLARLVDLEIDLSFDIYGGDSD